VKLEIREEAITHLDAHGALSIGFDVERVLDVEERELGLGGLVLVERRLERSYRKDYDSIAGNSPRYWSKRFDVSSWGLLAAYRDGARVGGAVIAFDGEGLMVEGRKGLGLLWDLRVAPAQRGTGIGWQLFRAAGQWARARGCWLLEIETQNVNVPACRFYVRQGCKLGVIDRFAYPAFPDEVRLLWYKRLAPAGR
jgi:GNAT superfamily N-acetyltransferase